MRHAGIDFQVPFVASFTKYALLILSNKQVSALVFIIILYCTNLKLIDYMKEPEALNDADDGRSSPIPPQLPAKSEREPSETHPLKPAQASIKPMILTTKPPTLPQKNVLPAVAAVALEDVNVGT